MSTYRVQMDGNGNFVEQSLEGAMAARSGNQGMSVTWRNVTNEKRQTVILGPSDAEQSITRMGSEAMRYFERNISPLLEPQKPRESDSAYADRMASLQYHQGIYDLMIANGITQAELSQSSGGTERAGRGITVEGVAQLQREAAAQEAQEAARVSKEFG